MTGPAARDSNPATGDRAFLSIIAWPDGASRDDNARLVADATGLDTVTARLRLGVQPPMIVSSFEDAVAQRAARAIDKAGGIAFAPTFSEIEWLGPTIKIRDMRMHEGRLLLDLWRCEPTSIDPGAIEVIVRGRTSESKVRSTPPQESIFAAPLRRMSIYGMCGSYGLAAGLYASLHATNPDLFTPERETHIAHKIDLHLRDGRVLQIDADKFGFQVLGEQRGLTDMINTDRLCEMLVAFAPDVTIDPYFALWRPPVDLKRVRIAQLTLNREDPAFAVYSRWAALMYRHMNKRLGVLGDEPLAGE